MYSFECCFGRIELMYSQGYCIEPCAKDLVKAYKKTGDFEKAFDITLVKMKNIEKKCKTSGDKLKNKIAFNTIQKYFKATHDGLKARGITNTYAKYIEHKAIVKGLSKKILKMFKDNIAIKLKRNEKLPIDIKLKDITFKNPSLKFVINEYTEDLLRWNNTQFILINEHRSIDNITYELLKEYEADVELSEHYERCRGITCMECLDYKEKRNLSLCDSCNEPDWCSDCRDLSHYAWGCNWCSDCIGRIDW